VRARASERPAALRRPDAARSPAAPIAFSLKLLYIECCSAGSYQSRSGFLPQLLSSPARGQHHIKAAGLASSAPQPVSAVRGRQRGGVPCAADCGFKLRTRLELLTTNTPGWAWKQAGHGAGPSARLLACQEPAMLGQQGLCTLRSAQWGCAQHGLSLPFAQVPSAWSHPVTLQPLYRHVERHSGLL